MCFPARMLVPRIAEYKGKGECLGRGVGDGGEKEGIMVGTEEKNRTVGEDTVYIFFDETIRVTETSLRLTLSSLQLALYDTLPVSPPRPRHTFKDWYLQLFNKILPSSNNSHPLPATPRTRLDEHRIPNPVGLPLQLLRILSFSTESRDEGDVFGVFEEILLCGAFVA